MSFPLPREHMAGPVVRAAVVGYGYWGPNLARNIAACHSMELVAIIETNAERRRLAAAEYPRALVRAEIAALLESADVDLVVIATPPATHFELAAMALEHGKHVLVEKPLALDVEGAEKLLRTAEKNGSRLLVDHTFLFTGAVRKMLEHAMDIGDVLYFDSIRTNLGTFQRDTDVLWDLAPHDLSILLSLVEAPVEAVSAVGARHMAGHRESMAYLTLQFAGGPLAHIHVNWFAPAKVRRTIVGGSRRMLVYDDIEASEKLKVYESPMPSRENADEDILRRLVDYRVGDVISPRLDQTEALRVEIEHVSRVLLEGEDPVSDGRLGLRVVRVLEAAHRSLERGGAPVGVDG